MAWCDCKQLIEQNLYVLKNISAVPFILKKMNIVHATWSLNNILVSNFLNFPQSLFQVLFDKSKEKQTQCTLRHPIYWWTSKGRVQNHSFTDLIFNTDRKINLNKIQFFCTWHISNSCFSYLLLELLYLIHDLVYIYSR